MGSDHPLARVHAGPALRLLRRASLGLLASALLAASPSTSAVAARGPFPLLTLHSLGSVTWSCAAPKEMWGLAVRIEPRSATTTVRFRAGDSRRSRTLDPGEGARFPVLRARRQWIHFEQRTGAGVLRARLRVEFGRGAVPSHCYPYAPPGIALQMEPL
jgi:hypothetical protein